MEKVQQDNDPNWYAKQPKCNSTHNFLLNTYYSTHRSLIFIGVL
jgi:hypothetical protein